MAWAAQSVSAVTCVSAVIVLFLVLVGAILMRSGWQRTGSEIRSEIKCLFSGAVSVTL